MFLLEALLRSVEALLYRLTGEAWQDHNPYQDRDQNQDPDQNQSLVGHAHCHSDGGECELQAGYTHPDYTQVHTLTTHWYTHPDYTLVHCEGVLTAVSPSVW